MQPDSLAYQAVFFPNLNISRKHRQIGGQSVRSALHKRFSIAVGCFAPRTKTLLVSAVQRSFEKEVEVLMSVKSCSAPPIVGLLNAPFYLLTFKTWIQMPLPLNISIEIYPGCAKSQESICLKSSIGQLLTWTSGLLFSEEKTAFYNLSSCMQHTQGWNSFQARRRQRGIVQL